MQTHRDGDEIVLRMKAGREAGGFARFLEGAADALAAGHIPPRNEHHTSTPEGAANQVRALAQTIHGKNV